MWQQIGAQVIFLLSCFVLIENRSHLFDFLDQEPSLAAQKVMLENDKAGYKAPTQMLVLKNTKRPTVSTVWQQIGAQVCVSSLE